MFGQNGALAQETLESQGLTVQINKIYPDESQSSMVDIGCVLDTEPAAGTTVKAGDTVTLTISRGINYGDSVQVPDVTGMEKNDAIAKLGKFININVEMQMSTDVAEGTVISQDPIGYTDDNPVYADPDNDTITLIVSSGSQDTSSQNTEDQSSSDTTAAVANGEVWKCTQKLKTPIGYNGGLIRLELVQNVGGAPKASSVVEGQQLTFPYQLDITGAPGVAEGTLYLSSNLMEAIRNLAIILLLLRRLSNPCRERSLKELQASIISMRKTAMFTNVKQKEFFERIISSLW